MIRAEKKTEKKKKAPLASAFARYAGQVSNTVLKGIKMSSVDALDPLTHPLKLMELLKKAGPMSLAWAPEVLCAYLDTNYGGWSDEKASNALDHFHENGVIQTSVPPLVRHKLYAIRTINISDSAHSDCAVFEKVGSAFNDRLADFSVVEPMVPVECSRTVSIINAIRPDEFSYEIKAYIAAACHLDGLYTVKPSKYLNMAEDLLSMMNKEQTGRDTNATIIDSIIDRLAELKVSPEKFLNSDDFITIQAIKLLAIDFAGDDAIRSED